MSLNVPLLEEVLETCLGFKYWADPTALSHEALDGLNAFVLAPCRIERDEIAGITAG
jgi:hypothetical protein